MLNLKGMTLSGRGSLAAAFAVVMLVLVLGSGRSGFWEPHEIDALKGLEQNRITSIAAAGVKAGARARAEELKTSEAPAAAVHEARDCEDGPVISLKERLVAASHRSLGGEWGARLPLIIATVFMSLMVWFLATLVASPRAGLFATITLITFPAILFGSKQVTGDSIGQAAATLAVLGGALVLRANATGHHRFIGALLALAGLWLGALATGLLVGVVAPVLAIAIAAWTMSSYDSEDAKERRRRLALGGAAGAIAVAALSYFVASVFDIVPAKSGDLHLFGKTLEACRGETAAAMASWYGTGNLEVGFNALVEDIGFGAFPWAAVAPFAMILLLGSRGPRREVIAPLLFAWAALAWILGGISERGAAPVHYTGYAALAVAIGVWIDDLVSGRLRKHSGLELAGLFAALAAVILAKDLVAFPEKLLSIGLTDGEYTAPKGSELPRMTIVTGLAFALMMALHLIVRSAPGRLGTLVRSGVFGAVASTMLFALFISHIALPNLSRALSSASSFELLREIRDDEPLGVLGRLGAGPAYYAGDDYVVLNNKNELYEFLGRDERVFALMPVADHCVLHSAQPGNDFEYYVIDDQNSKHLLLSNRLGEGERDRNNLARTIVRERPTDVGTPLSVSFDDEIELIGVRMPEAVGRGDHFEVTLYFEVKKRVRRNWKVFLHFDGGGQRFQGDHDPAERFCGTARWRPGDFIVDTIEVEAGGLTYAKGAYQVWAGFFSGSAGNWTNMKVTTPGADAANRYPIGTLRVK